jgi:hypothetical protein
LLTVRQAMEREVREVLEAMRLVSTMFDGVVHRLRHRKPWHKGRKMRALRIQQRPTRAHSEKE